METEKKKDSDNQDIPLTSAQVRVGSKTAMTRKERLEYLRNSSLGKLFGVAQFRG